MKLRIFAFCCLAVLAGALACKKKTSSPSTYTPTCNGTKSFQNDVKPLVLSSCNVSGCHSNYSNYAQISGSASSIRSAVANGSMPKGSSLSSSQKDIIMCWIDNGAPNN